MSSKRDLKVAIILMIVFMISGIICYASFTPPASEEPVRIMFQNKGGKVLFTHQAHVQDLGYGCDDCHHEMEDDNTYSCRGCHEVSGDQDLPSRADSMHLQCKGCHEDVDSGPVDCNSCHSL